MRSQGLCTLQLRDPYSTHGTQGQVARQVRTHGLDPRGKVRSQGLGTQQPKDHHSPHGTQGQVARQVRTHGLEPRG